MCIKMYILAKSSVRQFCSWEYSTNFMNPWSRTLVDTEKHLVQHLFCVQWSTTLGFSSEVPGLPFLDVDPKPDIISFHQKSAQSILPLFVKFQKVVVPWKIGKLGGQLAPSLRSTTQAILLCHSDVARNSVAYPKCYLVTMDTTRFQWSNEQNWIRKKKSRVFLFPSDHNQLHTFPNPKKKKTPQNSRPTLRVFPNPELFIHSEYPFFPSASTPLGSPCHTAGVRHEKPKHLLFVEGQRMC